MNKVTFDPIEHKYHDWLGRELPSVSWILNHFGLSQIDKLIAIHGQEHFDKLALFGHEVHKVTAADDQGWLHELEYDNELDPWLGGWRTFKDEHPQEFLAIEEPMASMAWGFAGTPDRVSLTELPDIKTGSTTLAERIQTALYQILAEENMKVRIKKRYAVHLLPWKYKLEPHNDPNEMAIAKSMLTILNYKRKKGIL